MLFMLCLATEAGHSDEAGGSNIALDGVDLIPSLFLYSIGNGTRCGRTIYREPSGIIGTK